MFKRVYALFVLFGLLVLSGCGSDGNSSGSSSAPPAAADPVSEIRITHASPDAPAVNVYIDGALALSNVDYKQSSGILRVPPATYNVEVRGILPDGSEVSVIGPVDITTMADERIDVVAYDYLFNGAELNIKALPIVAPMTTVTNAQITVLHAAPNAGDVDIYLTAPDAPLAGEVPVDAGFGDYVGPVDLMPGTEYQVRIALDGTDTVVYDSGPLSFSIGDELLVAAVENTTGIGDNPVNLLAVDRVAATELYSVGTGAEIRVVHNSADTPEVDILVNGTEVLDAVPFPVASNYEDISAPAGTYNVVVAADIDNSIAPIDENLTVANGSSYTAIAIGGLNNVTDNTLQLLVTADDRRTLATAAKLRVVHGSYAVAESIPVDVYLTSTADISGATPAITGLAYGEATSQLQVPAGDYYVTVTVAGDASTVAFAAGPLTLNADSNYTVIARDPGMMEVGSPLILATILNE